MSLQPSRLPAVVFAEYQPRKIVNVHRHVDGPWFWTKYSAHPYVGCRSGCSFCYLRAGRYLGGRSPDSFDNLIQVKTNAVQLLRRELLRLPPEVITCGDWQQPAEHKHGLSRRMLEVVLALGFPLFVIERSPLITRDLDLLQDIADRSSVTVAISLSNVEPALKRAFEPHSPGIRRRLEAMSALAEAGVRVGASLMPILPMVGDDLHTIDRAVRAVKDHGGSFVLGAGMTMGGDQAARTMAVARELDPDLERRWRRLYAMGAHVPESASPPSRYRAEVGRRVRERCLRHDIADRMPRPILAGPLSINKRIAERLFLRAYDLELEDAANSRIWAYRRAAWTVDEMADNIAVRYASLGEDGLRQLSGIGSRLAGQIASWLRDEPQGGTVPESSARTLSAF